MRLMQHLKPFMVRFMVHACVVWSINAFDGAFEAFYGPSLRFIVHHCVLWSVSWSMNAFHGPSLRFMKHECVLWSTCACLKENATQ